MNKSFILLDKNNNLQKTANEIVKFNYEGKDYLIYCVDENEQNSQIFVSRLILNSEGKTFIDNIMPEEKNSLNNIVYNIVILTPSDVQKGSLFNDLKNNLLDKFGVRLSLNSSELGIQDYNSNCSVAITSKILVDAATKIYNDNLVENNNNKSDVLVPTWTAPVEVTSPVPASLAPATAAESVSTVPVQEHVAMPNVSAQQPLPNLTVQSPAVEPVNVVFTPKPVEETVSNDSVEKPLPNPQAEKLAVVSDPSLGINIGQPNVGKNKKAGFANTKYIVIGTVCLVLAVAVVITAYILISNMK